MSEFDELIEIGLQGLGERYNRDQCANDFERVMVKNIRKRATDVMHDGTVGDIAAIGYIYNTLDEDKHDKQAMSALQSIAAGLQKIDYKAYLRVLKISNEINNIDKLVVHTDYARGQLCVFHQHVPMLCTDKVVLSICCELVRAYVVNCRLTYDQERCRYYRIAYNRAVRNYRRILKALYCK